MTTDLDHLYALAEGATETARAAIANRKTDTWLRHRQAMADLHDALSPDVVKGLIERVRRAEAALAKHDLAMSANKFRDVARTALEAKDE